MYFGREHYMKINILHSVCFFAEDSYDFHSPPTSQPHLLRSIVAGCLFASIVLDANEGPDNNSQYWVNTMRDSFTCNPRFSGLFSAGNFAHCLIVLEHPCSLIESFFTHPTFDRIYTGNRSCPRALHFLRRSYCHQCHFHHLHNLALRAVCADGTVEHNP